MNKSEQNTLEIALHNYKGVTPSSRWTSGSGRFTSKRALPPHCSEMTPSDALNLGGKTAQATKRMLRAYPKCRKCIAVTNWRAVGKLAKTEQEPTR
jgi:hypothetical protein